MWVARTGVPRPARACPLCAAGLVGDEYHLVFECSGLQGVRDQYGHLFAPTSPHHGAVHVAESYPGCCAFYTRLLAVLTGSCTADSEDEDGSSHQPDVAG